MVYFLASDEIESVSSSLRLDSCPKLMKTFPSTASYYYHFIKDGKRLIFYEIRRHNLAKISSVIYTNDGTVVRYESDFLQEKRNEKWENFFTFKVLPVIGIASIVNECIKVSFKRVLGHSYQPVVPDHVLNFDGDVFLEAVSSAGNYFIVSVHIYQKKSRSNKLFQWKYGSERRYPKPLDIFVLLEIQQQNSSYNVVEICRKKTQEYVQGRNATVYDMAIDEKQERLFFCVLSKIAIETSDLGYQYFEDILVYNVKLGIIEDSINVSSSSHRFMLYVFSHPKYGECIFAITQSKLIIFARNDIERYQLFHTESLIQSPHKKLVFKNRNNQILFCYRVTNGIKMRDVFDSSNETVIPYSSTIFPLDYSINVNESGEEIYIRENRTLKIYVYKSYLKNLLLLSAAVVSKTYSLSQLTEMKLPKHLYKYL